MNCITSMSKWGNVCEKYHHTVPITVTLSREPLENQQWSTLIQGFVTEAQHSVLSKIIGKAEEKEQRRRGKGSRRINQLWKEGGKV